MDRQDAAEHILRGPGWVTCSLCKGSLRELRVHDQVTLETCSQCDGMGQTPSVAYLEACALLGLPRPRKADFIRSKLADMDAFLATVDWDAVKGVTVDSAGVLQWKEKKP